jgi:hypothetical protein
MSLQAPILFFLRTPVGDVLSSFGKCNQAKLFQLLTVSLWPSLFVPEMLPSDTLCECLAARAAKDQDTLDEMLPDTIHMSTIYLMILLTSLAIVTVSINYYAALTAALFGAFGVMQVRACQRGGWSCQSCQSVAAPAAVRVSSVLPVLCSSCTCLPPRCSSAGRGRPRARYE